MTPSSARYRVGQRSSIPAIAQVSDSLDEDGFEQTRQATPQALELLHFLEAERAFQSLPGWERDPLFSGFHVPDQYSQRFDIDTNDRVEDRFGLVMREHFDYGMVGRISLKREHRFRKFTAIGIEGGPTGNGSPF